jgi:peptidyl-prolyl cis-trans isomerase C
MFTESSKLARRWPVQLSRRTAAAAVAVAVLAAAAVVGYVVYQGRGLPEGAAFSVDDTVVEADQVETRMKALQALYGIERPADDDRLDSFRRDTAKSMVVEILLREEAGDEDIVIADKAVQDTLTLLVEQRYPDSGRTAFVRALGELGASEKQVLDEIEQQMLVARLFDHVTGDVEVNDEQVREQFTDRRDELGTPERRTLRNIVVSTRAGAVRVLRALDAGVPFNQVVARSSLDAATRDKGGSLGTVAASKLAPRYAAAAFAAPVGHTFGPVHTRHGWNVGLVERALPARPAAYAKIADELRTTLVAERSFEVWTAWLRDVLADADVEYADDFRPDDPDEVPDMGAPTEMAPGQ